MQIKTDSDKSNKTYNIGINLTKHTIISGNTKRF